jgi:hypothetical protein
MHTRQGEAWTYNDKRMQADYHGMQHRVVQKIMECRSHGRVRHMFQIMRHKAQR